MADAEEWRAQRAEPPDPTQWREINDEALHARLVRARVRLLDIYKLVRDRDNPETAAVIDRHLGRG